MSPIESWIFGLSLPLRALKLILSRPTLLLLSVIPVLITIALYYWWVTQLQASVSAALLGQIMSWGWNPEGWAAQALNVLAKVLIILVGVITFSFGASLLAVPFNDFLAEQSEPHAAPPLPSAPKTSITQKAGLLFVDLVKTAFGAGLALVALLFSWIPFLNILAILLAHLLLTFQFISYPQTRRGEGLRAGIRFLTRYPFASHGLGFALSLLFALPIVSALGIPLAVVGGTLLFSRARAPQTAEYPASR